MVTPLVKVRVGQAWSAESAAAQCALLAGDHATRGTRRDYCFPGVL